MGFATPAVTSEGRTDLVFEFMSPDLFQNACDGSQITVIYRAASDNDALGLEHLGDQVAHIGKRAVEQPAEHAFAFNPRRLGAIMLMGLWPRFRI